jgi:predicted dehydrogenase
MNPVKLGIIGCGIAARELHWPALKQLKDKFEIRAVCNHTENKAREFSKLVGNVPYDLDYRDLLKRRDVQAVDIVLPIYLNYQVTKDALAAGKHVLVEKPLAANLAQAKKMLQFEERYKQVTMVAENFRYRPGLKILKKYLNQYKIGKTFSVFWDYFALMDSKNKYAHTAWRIKHKHVGGFITDGGVHNIAAIRYLFGDLNRTIALTASINKNIGEIDCFSMQFITTSGVQGILNIFLSSRGYSENRVLILGTKGSIILENGRIVVRNEDRIISDEMIQNDNGYVEEFEDFYQAIRNGKKVSSSFSECYKDLEVIIKAIQYGKRKK